MRTSSVLPLIALGILAACSIPKPTAFYATPAPADAKPGTVIAVQPYAPAPTDAAAWRVLYASHTFDGRAVAVSGVVYVPLGPPPAAGRDVVAWAHASSGIASGCAPSLNTGGTLPVQTAGTIPGLDQLLAAGDVVTATDYQGLGTPGPHPYLVGAAEAYDLIDSVRAAGALPGADISGRYVVWGHSQGGQAALFAGQLAAAYAPELHLLGIAAAAPPTDLVGEFRPPPQGNGDRLINSWLFTSWGAQYGAPEAAVVRADMIQPMHAVAQHCLNTIGQAVVALHDASALQPLRAASPSDTPPWNGLLSQNAPGGLPPGAPLLIVQGLRDDTVQPHWTDSFVARECATGAVVDYDTLKRASHVNAPRRALPTVTAWIAGRFAGKAPPNTCKKS